jgi:hypothetical protein
VGKRLVTVVTFDQAAQAQLAKNALDEEGIQAAVSDETLVAMDWLLSNAVGGVKVQVWEEDAERAVAVLEKKLGEQGEWSGPVSPEELAAAAEAATPDKGEEPEPERPATPTPTETTPAPVSDAVHRPSERDDYARRAVFTAILGVCLMSTSVVFLPLGLVWMFVVFYAVYLNLNASFGEGELSSRGRLNATVAWLLTLATSAVLFLFMFLIRPLSSVIEP